jgi:hypothetical protein
VRRNRIRLLGFGIVLIIVGSIISLRRNTYDSGYLILGLGIVLAVSGIIYP